MWQAKEPTLAAAELGMAGAGLAALVRWAPASW
jgi:hypothetical protein